MILSIYKRSEGRNTVAMEKEIEQATLSLRAFLFNNVYNADKFRQEEERADRMITSLYELYLKHHEYLPEFYRNRIEQDGINTVICDYISGMSDTYAVKEFEEYFTPHRWNLI